MIIIVLILIVIILAYLAFSLLYTKKCRNTECFYSSLEKCKEASFIDEASDASWRYIIKGSKGDECQVEVKLLQAKKGLADVKKIEGLKMECNLVKGYSRNPQSDLGRCHGLLKEGMQELMINKLHSYIISNIGEVSEELKKVI